MVLALQKYKEQPHAIALSSRDQAVAGLKGVAGLHADAAFIFAKQQVGVPAPWEHHNEKITIKRGQCLKLNDMAKAICEG